METFKVVQCTSNEFSVLNRAMLTPNTQYAEFSHIAVRYPRKAEAFVFSVAKDPALKPGEIAFNISSRKWASLQVNSIIQAAPYQFEAQQALVSITFQVDFLSRKSAPVNQDFNTEDMAQQFSAQFSNQAFTVGQLVAFVFSAGGKKVSFELKVKSFESVPFDDELPKDVEIGLTTPNTVYMFERAENSDVKLFGNMTGEVAAPQLFNQNWDLASMGIGGLSSQFNEIFRRAFATRLLPPQLPEKLGLNTVRGMLLYGPPGTGKTLIARQIGKMLFAREPKVVNGPEVLNKYVGESEANIRRLFAEAEEEQARAGLNSALHVIIFDEIDAICKARGSVAGSSGVGDSIVNQLLSKIDGVNSLNNVLLIGMTNRKDLIDEALLRPGRFEVQIEIGLPDKQGRLEILEVHTRKMRKEGILDSSVDLKELAEVTKNFTGAELEGLVKAAGSLAVNRVIRPNSNVDREALNSIRITWSDFKYVLEHDVKPALGASEDQLKELARPVIQWDSAVSGIQSELSQVIRQIMRPDAKAERPYYILIQGDPCSGLTTLAANMAAETGFPFIRVYLADTTAGDSESAKVQYMKKLFNDAARSELSCILIDDLEDILDYCHIGPRFSNPSRSVFIGKRNPALPKGHRMLVICTCKHEQFLSDLQLAKVFNSIIRVPSLTRPDQVRAVMRHLAEIGESVFSDEQVEELVEILDSLPFKMGIKELERLIESAVDDEECRRVKMFIERMHKLRLVDKSSKLDSFQFQFA